MAILRYLIFMAVAVTLGGCGMAGITSSIKGNYYIETGDYEAAEKTFQQMVNENPDNALNHYYLGRFLLAQDKNLAALPHFQKAFSLDQGDADFNFWLGVSYGEAGDAKAERKQYERTLNINSRHTQARLYLGHAQLQSGELSKALKSYDRVLEAVPANPSALYNRALVLDLKGRKSDAKRAWSKYLKWFPAGRHAIQAADNLNSLGDFSYENHFFGKRTVTLRKIGFHEKSEKILIESYSSLRLAGAIVSNLEHGNLQIVVYESDFRKPPKSKAIALRKKILQLSSDLSQERVFISWFNQPEEVATKQGKKYSKKSSVRLFLTDWK